jgi:hypothetical protein
MNEARLARGFEMDDRWFRLGDRGRYPPYLKEVPESTIHFSLRFPFRQLSVGHYLSNSHLFGIPSVVAAFSMWRTLVRVMASPTRTCSGKRYFLIKTIGVPELKT